MRSMVDSSVIIQTVSLLLSLFFQKILSHLCGTVKEISWLVLALLAVVGDIRQSTALKALEWGQVWARSGC